MKHDFTLMVKSNFVYHCSNFKVPFAIVYLLISIESPLYIFHINERVMLYCNACEIRTLTGSRQSAIQNQRSFSEEKEVDFLRRHYYTEHFVSPLQGDQIRSSKVFLREEHYICTVSVSNGTIFYSNFISLVLKTLLVINLLNFN